MADTDFVPMQTFLAKLRELSRDKLTAEEFDEMVRTARAHAGGRARASRLRVAHEGSGDALYALFVPYAFAEAGEWMPLLPKPGKFSHPRYGEIEITAERNARMIANFDRQVYQAQLPIDAEHEYKLSGAVGWIKGMRQNSDGSVDANVEWTDRGRSLIESGGYKYVSPEWYDEWTQPETGTKINDVAIGAAITTRPFFKERSLKPLVASEEGIAMAQPDGETDDDDEQDQDGNNGDAGDGDDEGSNGDGDDASNDNQEGDDMPNDDDKNKGGSESVTMTELESRIAAERTAREAAEANAKQMAERLAAVESESRQKRFTDEVRGRSDANNQAWIAGAAGIPGHVAMLESLAVKFGEDSTEFKTYVEMNREHARALTAAGAFREAGSSADGAPMSAFGELQAKAAAIRQANSDMTAEQALDRAFAENPDLANRYRNERPAR